MKNQSYTKLMSAVSLTLVLAACGGTAERGNNSSSVDAPASDVPYEVTEDYNSGVIRYTVQRGDRLGDIAQEFTGSAEAWREIAEFNGIDNPRQLREGMILEIPTGLIPGYTRPTPPTPKPLPTAQSQSVAQTSTLAVRRNESVEIAPVVVTPTTTNRDFDLNPIEAGSENQSQSYAGSGQQIKVIGSYYPKGIYTEPAPYSKLIMRVTPGSKFVLTSEVNGWYKIETNSGTGYIRTSDADIVQ